MKANCDLKSIVYHRQRKLPSKIDYGTSDLSKVSNVFQVCVHLTDSIQHHFRLFSNSLATAGVFGQSVFVSFQYF